jgi:hypothetical protein
VVSTPLKNMSLSVGIIIPNKWKVIKFHGSKSPSTLFHVISDSKNSNTGTELLRNLSMADFKHRTSIVGRQKSPSPGKKTGAIKKNMWNLDECGRFELSLWYFISGSHIL